MEENNKMGFFRTIPGTFIITLIVGIIGFIAGMEFKAYQVRKAIDEVEEKVGEVFLGTDDKNNTKEEKKDEEKIINKNMGDEIELATIKTKITSVKESDKLYSKYSEPTVTKDGAKFIIIDTEITNITKEPFTYWVGGDLEGADGVKYGNYEEALNVDNNLDARELQPGIIEKGVMFYQIPKNVDSYSYVIGKKGTNETYKIKLK